MIENRTKLKEKRNEWLWSIFFIMYFIGIGLYIVFVDSKTAKEDFALVPLMGIPLLFGIYRVLTYLFNQFLLLFFRGKKFKINRLKGRITPIYEIEEYIGFKINKYSVKYTNLNLSWSIPFSVLFQEQEYVLEGSYNFYSEDGYNIKKVTDISTLYESKDAENKLKYVEKISAKTIKQQKINNLNKVFNENYK